jgi:hypothetical protein
MGALLGIGLVVLAIGIGIAIMGPDCPWASGIGNVAASQCGQAEESDNIAGWLEGIGAVMSGIGALGVMFRRK